jgi:predicted nucleic acid-binding Zn ribbon protein
MNRELPPRIGDLLDDAGRRAGVTAAVETGKLWTRWREIVGPDVAAHARPSSLRDGVLRVRADSPTWATEIGYLGDEIRRRANDVAAREIVTEVRVWTGPSSGDAPDPGPSQASEFGPPSETQQGPTTDDPAVAMERARSAWARRSKGRSKARSTHPEIKRKPW